MLDVLLGVLPVPVPVPWNTSYSGLDPLAALPPASAVLTAL